MSQLIASEWTYSEKGFQVTINRFIVYDNHNSLIKYVASLKLEYFAYSIESEPADNAEKAIESLCENVNAVTSALNTFTQQSNEMRTTIKHRLSHDSQFS